MTNDGFSAYHNVKEHGILKGLVSGYGYLLIMEIFQKILPWHCEFRLNRNFTKEM